MNFEYLLLPFLSWFTAGSVKFAFSSYLNGKISISHIGSGGFPSNHSTIVSSMTTLVALQEGINSPVFGVSLAFSVIVLLDALDLRHQIGLQARKINTMIGDGNTPTLRERTGHTVPEVLAGILLGIFIALAISQ